MSDLRVLSQFLCLLIKALIFLALVKTPNIRLLSKSSFKCLITVINRHVGSLALLHLAN